METWKGPAWEAILRNGPRCEYCGLGDNGDPRSWQTLDIDHLIPRGRGHDDDPFNLVIACVGCNSTKQDFDPSDNGATPLNFENRPALISRARDYIKAANVGNSVPHNYRPLLAAIRRGAHPKIAAPANAAVRAAGDVGLTTPDMLS
jgi:HNH endonuclease